MDPTETQIAVTERCGTRPELPDPRDRLGVADNVLTDLLPLNGLRHRPENGTSGWYVWAGERLPDDPHFFHALHHEHLGDWCPAVVPYLGLPPGWRFLLAPGQEDVWFDETLVERGPGPAR